MSRPNAIDRVRQTGRLLRSEGAAGVATRLLNQATQRVAPAGYGTLPVARADLVRAGEIAADDWTLPPVLPARPGEPLTVAWVCATPGAGGGGATTMFRMVSALERAGHRCIVYIHDRHGWSIEQHRETVRSWWPWVDADIRSAADGIEDAHAIIATAWETAYPVLASPARGKRFYLVMDFEPSFHPAGSTALLAEATYRFGFHGITGGRWLSELVRRDYGMDADHFDFACDLDRYALDNTAGAPERRTGVAYYCRPSTPRRAHELAVVALDLFAARHPEVPIHLYGEPGGRLPFAATEHGLLPPEQLNTLYNRCIAGLVLSATNVSLVPHEMLAAGCIPVVNDAEHNRIVLDNPEVAYAAATPFDLANALSFLVERSPAERETTAARAAASVDDFSWEQAGAQVEAILSRVVTTPETGAPPAQLASAPAA